jgi:glucose-6-phosphate isomerase
MRLVLDSETSHAHTVVSILGNDVASYVTILQRVADSGVYAATESSINLPFDDSILSAAETLVAAKVTLSLRYIFVIGIGGSNLGIKAIYEALHPNLKTAREIVFLDTNNASTIQSALKVLDNVSTSDEVLFISISKSGGTSETLANTEIILEKAFLKWGRGVRDRLVVITDEGSPFALAALERKVTVLTLPISVGGRYSVFSAVGVFPLLAFGVPVADLLRGARDMRMVCLNPYVTLNYATISACLLYQGYQDGLVVHDTFVFQSELESVGKWYRQLLGESIGKQLSGSKEGTRVGITPTVSVGSTDLHSVGQLYLGGHKRTFTTFVYSDADTPAYTVPKERMFPTLAPMITGHTTTDIMSAILRGTTTAYRNERLPFVELVMDGITPYELGAFMQCKMMEVMYLGYLFGINTFDQPAVELYKIETKRLLEGGDIK